jgi:C4-dicarboxylate transporter DctM subunit
MPGGSAGSDRTLHEPRVSPELQLLLVTALFLGLLTAGMAVPFAIMVPALVYLLLQGGPTALNSLGLVSWGSMNSFVLTTVPLFMLMAEILSLSGLSSRIYSGLEKLVARLPGGLLQTNIAGCAIFASVSGSSIATAASIGGVALPQLIQRRYNRALAAGSLAAGGTLGILIPPSFPMIIYGTFTETSVPKLFIAGIIPGLIMTALFMIYIAIHAKLEPSVAPREAVRPSLRETSFAMLDVLPFFVLILVTVGGLYFGWTTTTEAAAIGCVLSILLGMTLGNLTWRSLVQAIHNTIYFSGNILFLILAAYIFSVALSFGGVGEKVTEFVVGLNLSKLEFYLALFVLFTILGCLIESLGMIVITVPLLYPILARYNIDPILFGVILVIYVELGQISPPIGINLFVIQSIWDGKLSEVVLGTIPFHLIMFVVLAMVVFWPELALWLPATMSK